MEEVFPGNASAAAADRHRRDYTWPIYLSGGDLEYILDELLKTDNYRKYEPVWKYTWNARKFLEQNLPFWEMEPMDELLTGAATYQGKNNLVTGQVFAKLGEIYAVYLPAGGATGILDLSATRGEFLQRWYNPRTGEFAASSRVIAAGKAVALGSPPSERLSIHAPPGYGKPKSLAVLSKASPAASSRVRPTSERPKTSSDQSAGGTLIAERVVCPAWMIAKRGV